MTTAVLIYSIFRMVNSFTTVNSMVVDAKRCVLDVNTVISDSMMVIDITRMKPSTNVKYVQPNLVINLLAA